MQGQTCKDVWGAFRVAKGTLLPRAADRASTGARQKRERTGIRPRLQRGYRSAARGLRTNRRKFGWQAPHWRKWTRASARLNCPLTVRCASAASSSSWPSSSHQQTGHNDRAAGASRVRYPQHGQRYARLITTMDGSVDPRVYEFFMIAAPKSSPARNGGCQVPVWMMSSTDGANFSGGRW